MTLREFLSYFDFDYEIIDNDFIDIGNEDDGKVFALIDLQGANLGGIDKERFTYIEGIVDRLTIYYEDYIIGGLEDFYDIDCVGNYEEIYNNIKDLDYVNDYYKILLQHIINPSLIKVDE